MQKLKILCVSRSARYWKAFHIWVNAQYHILKYAS